MGSTTPKQFIELCGKPILRHTVERFLEYDPSIGIITVIPGQYKQFWKEYCEKSGFIERYSMPSGGITRFHSVQNALEYVPDGALVAVHDGVRPFVSAGFISSLFETARADGSAVPVLPVIDSIREIGPEGSHFESYSCRSICPAVHHRLDKIGFCGQCGIILANNPGEFGCKKIKSYAQPLSVEPVFQFPDRFGNDAGLELEEFQEQGVASAILLFRYLFQFFRVESVAFVNIPA